MRGASREEGLVWVCFACCCLSFVTFMGLFRFVPFPSGRVPKWTSLGGGQGRCSGEEQPEPQALRCSLRGIFRSFVEAMAPSEQTISQKPPKNAAHGIDTSPRDSAYVYQGC